MKSGNTNNAIYKEVVIIGNGPSGITLSYMLAGNLPYIISDSHGDEMLSMRLKPLVGQCLLQQDLEHLSMGLEGRSTNQLALLMDSLLHPCADIGLEMEPLIEFRKTGTEIDHIVLGKGPPGGSWHRMDPYILTLSLDSWMALPGLPFQARDSGEKRAFASSVAKYYVEYTEKMQLEKYFKNNVVVTSVEPINQITEKCQEYTESNTIRKKYSVPDSTISESKGLVASSLDENYDEYRTCFISNAINYLMLRGSRKKLRCKRPREIVSDNSPRKIREIIKSDNVSFFNLKPSMCDKKRSVNSCCDSNSSCDSYCSKSCDQESNSSSLRNSNNVHFKKTVPYFTHGASDARWIVNTVDKQTGERISYRCKYLVLANGGSDLPNRLEFSKIKEDPDWLLYDLRSLESKLDSYITEKGSDDIEPVLVIGAGLSAADAIVATRGRNIQVNHVFRNKSAELNKQLPENMYPEYHKVYQMMNDGGSTYPLYTAYPEYSLTDVDDKSHTTILTSKDGAQLKLNVSFVVVLIGSRPDLSFLPKDFNLGVNKALPVDCKTNPIDIDAPTYKVNGFDSLFTVGPLAGDNFVRFLPGGALAVVSEIYRQK